MTIICWKYPPKIDVFPCLIGYLNIHPFLDEFKLILVFPFLSHLKGSVDLR